MIAVNRNPDSFVGGATVLHQSKESPRSSQDIDLFHDTQEIITQAYEADVKALRQNGFEIDRVGMQQGGLISGTPRRTRSSPWWDDRRFATF